MSRISLLVTQSHLRMMWASCKIWTSIRSCNPTLSQFLASPICIATGASLIAIYRSLMKRSMISRNCICVTILIRVNSLRCFRRANRQTYRLSHAITYWSAKYQREIGKKLQNIQKSFPNTIQQASIAFINKSQRLPMRRCQSHLKNVYPTNLDLSD